MAYFARYNRKQKADTTPYTIYYPHSIDVSERKWETHDYYQVVSIDPGCKNYAFRIEKRYNNGWITCVVFDKVSVESYETDTNSTTITKTYSNLTNFLDKYSNFYNECHYVLIERQLPHNYKATRIAQHTLSYFIITLKDKGFLPTILEVDPKLKGKMLGVEPGINDKQLKKWAVEKAKELLVTRKDKFSLDVLDLPKFRRKQDDLCDTICQIEAIFKLWNLPCTRPPPPIVSL